MKDIYLLANAHIDPVWQWGLDEGIACHHSLLSRYHSMVFLMPSANFVSGSHPSSV